MADHARLATPDSTANAISGNSYDEVPYESYPFAQTHPSRLATIATLFGLKPAPIDRCRVLELGCAAGGNIVPMAELHPTSEFVGIDLSGRQIADGQRVVRTAGLTHVNLRHASILDVDESYGLFDYIICHGVFSWVPDAVREKILDICSKNMTPNGVAYVSYNTYPGWRMRGMIRDMMRFHALRFDSADMRVKQARALLDFLTQSAPNDGGAYSTLLRTELEQLKHQADHYLYHEHLEDTNEPLYFHQFAALAEKHGLTYLGESRLTTMVSANFTPEVQKTLQVVASDQVQAEQYMDFVRNRTFRETLLVKSTTAPNWAINPEAIHSLHITTTVRPTVVAGDGRDSETVQYQTKSGMVLSTSSPELKAAMRVLATGWPATVSFPELNHKVNESLGKSGDDGQALAMGLLNTYLAADLLELHATPITAPSAGERPEVLATSRARLGVGATLIANRRHEMYRPTEFDLRLIPLLDGTRNSTDILDELTQRVLDKDLTISRDGQPISDPAAIRKAIGPVLRQTLIDYANAALLK
jgi:methyltransferase-like protein/SAM-dependent methyltransferase